MTEEEQVSPAETAATGQGARNGPWELLTVLRTKDGHSIRSLAAAADITPAYLLRLERGDHQPSARVLTSLARALNVPRSVLEQKRAD